MTLLRKIKSWFKKPVLPKQLEFTVRTYDRSTNTATNKIVTLPIKLAPLINKGGWQWQPFMVEVETMDITITVTFIAVIKDGNVFYPKFGDYTQKNELHISTNLLGTDLAGAVKLQLHHNKTYEEAVDATFQDLAEWLKPE